MALLRSTDPGTHRIDEKENLCPAPHLRETIPDETASFCGCAKPMQCPGVKRFNQRALEFETSIRKNYPLKPAHFRKRYCGAGGRSRGGIVQDLALLQEPYAEYLETMLDFYQAKNRTFAKPFKLKPKGARLATPKALHQFFILSKAGDYYPTHELIARLFMSWPSEKLTERT